VDGSQDTLLDFAVIQELSRIVQAPTRGDNLLDMILTNTPLSTYNFDEIETFSISDHCQVIFSVAYLVIALITVKNSLQNAMTGLMLTVTACLIT